MYQCFAAIIKQPCFYISMFIVSNNIRWRSICGTVLSHLMFMSPPNRAGWGKKTNKALTVHTFFLYSFFHSFTHNVCYRWQKPTLAHQLAIFQENKCRLKVQTLPIASSSNQPWRKSHTEYRHHSEQHPRLTLMSHWKKATLGSMKVNGASILAKLRINTAM